MAVVFFLCDAASSELEGAEIRGPQSGVWSLAASPYIVTGNLVIPENSVLTIEPGVVIKFAGYFNLEVLGTLIAAGEIGAPIVFTSINDNEFGGSNKLKNTLPTRRDWQGLEFSDLASIPSKLDFCIIRYSDEIITGKFTEPVLANLIISDCSAEHIVINGKMMKVRESVRQDYILASKPENSPSTSLATIRGAVKDQETGKGLPGANLELVPLDNTGQSATTAADERGEFDLGALTPGRYTLLVTYIGYAGHASDTFSLVAGETKTFDIALAHVGIPFNPVAVTASLGEGKSFEAPGAVTVIEAAGVQPRPALVPVEHLKAMPAVDFASTGINQANVVVRGFNNVFSGRLLALADHRRAHVPSLRCNAFNLISTSGDDLERIEIASGPGAVWHGPDGANGVLHFITKSPFGSEGTQVTVGGGERIEFTGAFRHAHSFKQRVGYRFSGQYYRGKDWQYRDPAEPESYGSGSNKTPAPGRDFTVERISGDGRIDFRAAPEVTAILSAGFTRLSDIELTGMGAAQAREWISSYAQARLHFNNFFAQAYANFNDAGKTFLLRSGQPIVDFSQVYAAQVQHGLGLGEWQRFSYGLDFSRTHPDTKGTSHGRHESRDEVDEIGAFLHSETVLTSRASIIAAARLDDHSFVTEPIFSPRFTLLLKPDERKTLRLSCSRAYNTPASNHLFLDVLSGSVTTAEIDPRLAPVFGPVFLNVYAEGTAPRRGSFPYRSEGGFTFRFDQEGRPQMISAFGPILGVGNSYLAPEVNSVWSALRALVLAERPEGPQKAALAAALPQQLRQQVPGTLRAFNPTTQAFDRAVSGVTKIDQIRPAQTTTYEAGFRALMGEKLIASVEVYHSSIRDFIGPLTVETPHVFADPRLLAQVLAADLRANGFPAQLAEPAAQQIAESLAQIPLGLISPQEVRNATDVILTYRNFGKIELNGADVSLGFQPYEKWRLHGTYSHVSRDFFKRNKSRPHDLALNAPQHKLGASVEYFDARSGLAAFLRMRHVAGFPVNSGVYAGKVPAYTVFDGNLGYTVKKSTQITLAVQNLLDRRYREFAGAPRLGRVVIARLTQSF